MSTDSNQFTQDYWMNSLAIGHPLAFHSNSEENTSEDAIKMDEHHAMQWNITDMAKYDSKS